MFLKMTRKLSRGRKSRSRGRKSRNLRKSRKWGNRVAAAGAATALAAAGAAGVRTKRAHDRRVRVKKAVEVMNDSAFIRRKVRRIKKEDNNILALVDGAWVSLQEELNPRSNQPRDATIIIGYLQEILKNGDELVRISPTEFAPAQNPKQKLD